MPSSTATYLVNTVAAWQRWVLSPGLNRPLLIAGDQAQLVGVVDGFLGPGGDAAVIRELEALILGRGAASYGLHVVVQHHAHLLPG